MGAILTFNSPIKHKDEFAARPCAEAVSVSNGLPNSIAEFDDVPIITQNWYKHLSFSTKGVTLGQTRWRFFIFLTGVL